MTDQIEYIVGTCGYSFADWIGPFYPEGTRSTGMFELYCRHFPAVELNFTYYRMPTPRTLEALARRSPDGFEFWVKANQEITHKFNRKLCGQFIEALDPLAGKLGGVLLQFPQSFHRTPDNRRYLAGTLEDMSAVPLAVEFRHASWDHTSTLEGLRERNATLVVPDVPELEGLYRVPATITTPTGYIRLHSRTAGKWYAGGAERYDYDYSQQELQGVLENWSRLAGQVERVYAFFNNCHRGQAAANAEAFRRLIGQV